MSTYDNAIKRLQEMDRLLSPLRHFERSYGRGVHQVIDEINARNRLLQPQFSELSTSYLSAIQSLRPAIDTFRDFDHSPAFTDLASAHSDLVNLLNQRADLESIARASQVLGPQWEQDLAPYSGLNSQMSAVNELALKAHYTSVVKSAFLAQERLATVPWHDLGAATGLPGNEFTSVRDLFTSLSSTYRSLLRSLDEREHFLAGFPPIVSDAPPIEVLTSARVLDYLSRSDADDSFPESERQAESDIIDEIESSLEELLSDLHPDLVSMWRGAQEAIDSHNPDRLRHVAFSLRELVTHVIHMLAPDEEVREWSDDPDHYRNGRPTRQARLLFVCRTINHGPFSDFVEVDTRAGVSLIRLFQRGHELSVPFSEAQVRVLFTRTESLLRSLILTARVKP